MNPVLKIKISEASPEDVKEIAQVFYTTWLVTYPNEEFGITVDDVHDKYKDSFKEESLENRRVSILNPKEGSIFLVAKDGGKVVGVCRATVHTDKNELQAMYVLPECQGRGIGKLLWQYIHKIFDTKKDSVVNVVTYNTNAIEFYKKLGFVDTGKRFSDERFKMKSGAMFPEMQMIIKATDK